MGTIELASIIMMMAERPRPASTTLRQYSLLEICWVTVLFAIGLGVWNSAVFGFVFYMVIGNAAVCLYSKIRGRVGLESLGLPLAFGFVQLHLALTMWGIDFRLFDYPPDLVEASLIVVAISFICSLGTLRPASKQVSVLSYRLTLLNIPPVERAIIIAMSSAMLISLLPVWPASSELRIWRTSLWKSDVFVIYD